MNPDQHRGWISGIRSLAASAAVALAVVLVPVVVTTHLASAQNFKSFKVLHSFTGTPDGSSPGASLLRDTAGNLYSTTTKGGSSNYCNGGCGTVFKVDSSGKETVLYSFTGAPDGKFPLASLVRDAAGNLYGITVNGGSFSDYGTVFKVDSSGKETVLHRFTGAPDGQNPYGFLFRDAAGNLYGTTTFGGDGNCNIDYSPGCGTVFKVDSTGKETVLYSFQGGEDGAYPAEGLVQDQAGNFYSTTNGGGGGSCAGGCGTVFKLSKTGKETVLHRFTGTPNDGEYATGGVILDAAGNLYGTTSYGGAYNDGTVYKVSKTGKETVLYSFTGGNDGGQPLMVMLVRDAAGNLYGTTDAFLGNVFKLDTSRTLTVLHAFTGRGDGSDPYAGVVLDKKGNLYGTALDGASGNNGTVFKLGR